MGRSMMQTCLDSLRAKVNATEEAAPVHASQISVGSNSESCVAAMVADKGVTVAAPAAPPVATDTGQSIRAVPLPFTTALVGGNGLTFGPEALAGCGIGAAGQGLEE